MPVLLYAIAAFILTATAAFTVYMVHAGRRPAETGLITYYRWDGPRR